MEDNTQKKLIEEIKKHDPANPLALLPQHYQPYVHFGLSKREYFAGIALQAMISVGDERMSSDAIAKWSVHYANALIEELAKDKK